MMCNNVFMFSDGFRKNDIVDVKQIYGIIVCLRNCAVNFRTQRYPISLGLLEVHQFHLIL